MSNALCLASYVMQGISRLDKGCLEHHILNAYAKTFMFRASDTPDFFDISDFVGDELAYSGKYVFYSEYLDFEFHRSEITQEVVQYILQKMQAEFINIEGCHVNDSQNILFEEWLPWTHTSYLIK